MNGKSLIKENFHFLIRILIMKYYYFRQFNINQSHAKFAEYYVSNYQYNKYNKHNYLNLV